MLPQSYDTSLVLASMPVASFAGYAAQSEDKAKIDDVDLGRILAAIEALMEPLAIKKAIDFRCQWPDATDRERRGKDQTDSDQIRGECDQSH